MKTLNRRNRAFRNLITWDADREELEQRLVPATITVVNAFDTGLGSLRDAVTKANSNPGDDSIVFDPSLNGKTIVLGSQLVINDSSGGKVSIAVDSNMVITISGGKSTNHLSIATDTSLKGLRLIDGFRNGYSFGSISTTASLSLDNITFSGNSNSYDGGSCISGGSINKKVLVNNCTFSGNPGNAISIRNSELVIANSTFANNMGNTVGAILCSSNLTIINCFFNNNSGSTGAIYAMGDSNITDSLFANNSGSQGGAIRLISGKSIVNGCRFLNNNADGPSDANLGGAIYMVRPASLSVYSSYFEKNTSFSGGSIYFRECSLNISDSQFKGNSAVKGGAVGTYASSSHLSIENSSFVGNTAGIGGAIFESQASGIKIVKSTFANNSAQWGGALYANDSPNIQCNISITSSTLANNKAINSAGAIYSNVAMLSIKNSIVGNNSAPDYPDIYGQISSSNYSLYSSKPQILLNVKSIFNQDPFLGSLMSYGSNQSVSPLLPTSLAIGSA
jgi:hypothetical protein